MAQAQENELLTLFANSMGYTDAQDMVSKYSQFTDFEGHDPHCATAVLLRVVQQRLFKGNYIYLFQPPSIHRRAVSHKTLYRTYGCL